jgi:hypothetical protein
MGAATLMRSKVGGPVAPTLKLSPSQECAMRRLFHENVGPVDQWLRLSVGFVLLMMAGTDLIGPWGYVGVLPMVTAMVRYCPLYHLFGVDTRPPHRRRGS